MTNVQVIDSGIGLDGITNQDNVRSEGDLPNSFQTILRETASQQPGNQNVELKSADDPREIDWVYVPQHLAYHKVYGDELTPFHNAAEVTLPPTTYTGERSRWANPDQLTFAIPQSTDSYPQSTYDEPFEGYRHQDEIDNFRRFPTHYHQPIAGVVEAYNNISGLEISDSNDEGSATLKYALRQDLVHDRGAGGMGFMPDIYSPDVSGEMWYDNDDVGSAEPRLGSYAYLTLLHETGHALGLDHTFVRADDPNTGDVTISGFDDLRFSVMSYGFQGREEGAGGDGQHVLTNDIRMEEGSWPQSLMRHDIAAIQYLYGANWDYNSDDTYYAFNSETGKITYQNFDSDGQLVGSLESFGVPLENKMFYTIWDGGGTDTFDLSNYDTDLIIDLRPGEGSTFSEEQLAENNDGVRVDANVYNPYLYTDENGVEYDGSLIERAIGGSGNDILRGNQAQNHLVGGAGQDRIAGGTGDDELHGGVMGDRSGDGEADTFVINSGDGHDIILDFEVGIDRIETDIRISTVELAAKLEAGLNIDAPHPYLYLELDETTSLTIFIAGRGLPSVYDFDLENTAVHTVHPGEIGVKNQFLFDDEEEDVLVVNLGKNGSARTHDTIAQVTDFDLDTDLIDLSGTNIKADQVSRVLANPDHVSQEGYFYQDDNNAATLHLVDPDSRHRISINITFSQDDWKLTMDNFIF